MSPAQQAKAAGLKSLLQVSELTGVSIQTLSNWAKNKPELFQVVISGSVKELLISQPVIRDDFGFKHQADMTRIALSTKIYKA